MQNKGLRMVKEDENPDLIQYDGIVMGAEGEENSTVKRRVFKLPLYSNKRGERLIIGGAGPAHQVDSISQKLNACFKAEQHENSDELQSRFEFNAYPTAMKKLQLTEKHIVDGNMSGGFALIAYPAKYGFSGVMTFIVNQNAVVYQKDLG